MEKYDSLLAKNASYSKAREQAETLGLLKESKRQYLSNALDLVHKTCVLKSLMRPFVSEQLLPAVKENLSLAKEKQEILNGLIEAAEIFQKTWAEDENNIEKLESIHSKWKAELLIESPEQSILISSSNILLNEKEGYLFRKIDQKWIRKYYAVKSDIFITSLGRMRL